MIGGGSATVGQAGPAGGRSVMFRPERVGIVRLGDARCSEVGHPRSDRNIRAAMVAGDGREEPDAMGEKQRVNRNAQRLSQGRIAATRWLAHAIGIFAVLHWLWHLGNEP